MAGTTSCPPTPRSSVCLPNRTLRSAHLPAHWLCTCSRIWLHWWDWGGRDFQRPLCVCSLLLGSWHPPKKRPSLTVASPSWVLERQAWEQIWTPSCSWPRPVSKKLMIAIVAAVCSSEKKKMMDTETEMEITEWDWRVCQQVPFSPSPVPSFSLPGEQDATARAATAILWPQATLRMEVTCSGWWGKKTEGPWIPDTYSHAQPAPRRQGTQEDTTSLKPHL